MIQCGTQARGTKLASSGKKSEFGKQLSCSQSTNSKPRKETKQRSAAEKDVSEDTP